MQIRTSIKIETNQDIQQMRQIRKAKSGHPSNVAARLRSPKTNQDTHRMSQRD